jgi:hypothetical protein
MYIYKTGIVIQNINKLLNMGKFKSILMASNYDVYSINIKLVHFGFKTSN